MAEFDLFPNTLEPVKVTPDMKKSWKGISRWAIFFSVVGFLGVLVGLIAVMTSLMRFIVMGARFGEMGRFPLFVLLLSGLMVGISFATHFFHIKFAANIQSAIRTENQRVFDSAWRSFKNHFQYQGILLILVILLVITVVFYFTFYAPYPMMMF